MDKQGRLTKLDEWVPGNKYKWLKGRTSSSEVYTFIKIIDKIGVILRMGSNRQQMTCFNWKKRFKSC